jgi:hypothetical protein
MYPSYLYKCVPCTTNLIVCGFRSAGSAVSHSVSEAMAGRNQHNLSESEVWERRDADWCDILMVCTVSYGIFSGSE